MELTNSIFLLIAAHGVVDFPLQGEAEAINKSRHAKTTLQQHVPWYCWLGAHALTHGLAVALITHSPLLGMLETWSHFLIDYAKCEKWFSIHVDQALHVFCKIVWALLAFYGIGTV